MRSWLVLLIVALVAACNGDSPTALRGSLGVDVVTGGEYPDVDGYVLSVAGQQPRQVGTGESLTIDLDAGTHAVSISDVDPPCTLRGSASRDVEIANGEVASVRFEIDCLTQPEECTFGVNFGTTGGLTPEFTWNPVCRVVTLYVADLDAPSGEALRWRIEGAPFRGPVQYGAAPSGTTEDHAAKPLIAGHTLVAGVEFYTHLGGLTTQVENWTP